MVDQPPLLQGVAASLVILPCLGLAGFANFYRVAKPATYLVRIELKAFINRSILLK